MRLKRLHLFGFKSFADRTTFEFGDNTLTGVVGPNGCGKSNVVDSVRWVLGEQRPTSMRGSEMTDVIFKGSSSRPGLSVAEVTLILDNGSGILEGRGPEVSITRRVFKSGEGEYLLDGDKVRLKDVREMLFDTGLGSRGYSVLEQGRIDAVLSANPLERRRIFEEAAGISRYRQRKIETELRLKRVADDMTRLDDVLGELGTRVRSLKIQAGKAERFAAARDEWALQRKRYFEHRLWTWNLELFQLGSRAGELEEKAGLLRKAREEAESDVEVRERERGSLSAELERLTSESSRLAGDGRAADERRAQLSSRISSWKESARDEEVRRAALDAALNERATELARLRTELAELSARAEMTRTQAAASTQSLRDVDARWRDVRTALEKQNSAVLALLAERTQAENRMAGLDAARAPAQERGSRLVERLSGLQVDVDTLKAEESRLQKAAAETLETQNRHEMRRREMAQTMAELARESAEAEAEKKDLELERARTASRIDVLLDRERDLEDVSAGAKRVLAGVSERSEPVAPTALLGFVADQLRTDTRHARALDAVLGHRANALVAADLDTARRVVGWLKKSEAGQVGLVLPGGVGTSRTRGVQPTGAGVIGPLRDKVRCAKGSEALLDLLCGDVLIVRDLDTALELAAQSGDWRFVTMEGEFVDAAGLAGGHRALTQGAVGRRASAEELRSEVDGLSQAIEGLEERRAALAQQRMALQKDWERSTQELEASRVARTTAESQLATARARLRDQEAGLRALEQESGASVAEIARLEHDLAAAQTAREKAAADHDRERERLSTLESQRADLEARREEQVRVDSLAQVDATRARAELDGLERRVADLARVRAENEIERARAARLSQEHAENARDGEASLEELAEAGTRLLEARAELDVKLAEVRRMAESGRGLIEVSRKRVEGVTRELESTTEALSSLRLEEQRRVLARDEVVRRAQEELQLDEQGLMDGFVPEEALRDGAALEALESEVKELKSRLDKIGPVNMEAVTELQESGSRLEFLTAQRDDLQQARQALEETIKTIDVESKRLFMETFDAVRANFQRIFRQLFGGGKADVTLEEGVDPLDAGVDIVARPPGRELLSIGLLSGGQRTLTALALLFAVFEARPSPFCILDEVDAALDDANIERFLGMLDEFRRSTQFIIVTHNKGTMAACESLYGVTMETKGVSKQVSVEIGEAENWTQGPTLAPSGTLSAPRPPTEEELPIVEIRPHDRRAVEAAPVEGTSESAVTDDAERVEAPV